MIRLVITGIFVALFLILTIPLMIVCWIMGRFNRDSAGRLANSVVMWGFRSVWKLCGIRIEVRGKERVPQDKPLLYVGNHRSIFDIVVAYPLCKCPTGVIAKKSTARIPLLNIWMMLLGCLFLDRKNTRKGLETILKAIEQAKNGASVLIFPEGTRNRNYDSDELLPMHNGSFKIATKSGALIQPVTMVGVENIIIRHIPFVKPTKVIVEFGDPIDPSTLDKEAKKDIGGYVRAIMQETYSAIKKETK